MQREIRHHVRQSILHDAEHELPATFREMNVGAKTDLHGGVTESGQIRVIVRASTLYLREEIDSLPGRVSQLETSLRYPFLLDVAEHIAIPEQQHASVR